MFWRVLAQLFVSGRFSTYFIDLRYMLIVLLQYHFIRLWSSGDKPYMSI